MLLIFDLDDTLIDTSGCIVPVKLKDAFEAMINAGMKVESEQKALSLLLKINMQSHSGKEALQKFLKEIGGDDSLLEIALKEYYGNIKGNFRVHAFAQASALLNELGQDHQLALVTEGIESQQYEKMKKAGIDKDIFDAVIISTSSDKKPHYQYLLRQFGQQEALVCGDRWKTDLLPAQELGITTVHMQWGRGAHALEGNCHADYNIKSLAELRLIVQGITCRQ